MTSVTLQVYHFLLRNGRSTIQDIAEAIQWDVRLVQAALDVLARHEMVRESYIHGQSGKASTYKPILNYLPFYDGRGFPIPMIYNIVAIAPQETNEVHSSQPLLQFRLEGEPTIYVVQPHEQGYLGLMNLYEQQEKFYSRSRSLSIQGADTTGDITIDRYEAQ